MKLCCRLVLKKKSLVASGPESQILLRHPGPSLPPPHPPGVPPAGPRHTPTAPPLLPQAAAYAVARPPSPWSAPVTGPLTGLPVSARLPQRSALNRAARVTLPRSRGGSHVFRGFPGHRGRAGPSQDPEHPPTARLWASFCMA